MANNTTLVTQRLDLIVVAYYALTLVIAGTVFNLLTFVIFCRSKLRNTNERPAVHYIRAIIITDILMLYGWNFDHYLSAIHGFTMISYSIPTCKIFSFLNYFPAQTSAWLRVFLCLDRYLLLSRHRRTWFSYSKNVLIVIACVIGVLILFNLHVVIFGCFYDVNGSISPDSHLYLIYPLWNYVTLVVYNCLPFVLMVLLNSGVIYYLIDLRRTSTVRNSRIQHRSISITLVITTFLFLIMTIPATVAYSFFINVGDPSILELLDGMLFTYHVTSFPLYFITLQEFRQEFFNLILCKNMHKRIQPVTRTVFHTDNYP
jgi:hypothetical protein